MLHTVPPSLWWLALHNSGATYGTTLNKTHNKIMKSDSAASSAAYAPLSTKQAYRAENWAASFQCNMSPKSDNRRYTLSAECIGK